MTGDDFSPTGNHHLMNIAPHQNFLMTEGCRNRIIVAAIAHEGQRTHPNRLFVAGVIGNNWQGLKLVRISHKPLPNRAFVTTQFVAHALAALFGQMCIEIIKTGKLGFGHHEVTTGISHHPFNFTFVIALARAAKAILKQIMRHQFREYTGSFAGAVPKNAGNRDPSVVIENGNGHAPEERERRDMCITERLRRLSRICLHKTRI